MNNVNIDLYNKNLEACLKQVVEFGANRYYNLCDGTTKTVPWGGYDWVMLGIIISFSIISLIVIGILVVAMIGVSRPVKY